jgi:DNA-binding transcriptional MerR regulator
LRISQLSRRTDVPVGTIKYYLREHLLPPSKPTGRNQAEYGDEHVRRLLLIRALATLGDLDLSTIRKLLAVIDDESVPLTGLYDAVHRHRPPTLSEPGPNEAPDVEQARAAVAQLVESRGWRIDGSTPSIERLAQVLAALVRMGCGQRIDFFVPYAEAAERLAAQQLALVVTAPTDRAAAVVRTVLLESALAAIGQMAQEHLLKVLFNAGTQDSPGESAG